MTIEIDDFESEAIFNDILFDYILSKSLKSSKKPIAVILGGQPGSGKSYLVEEVEFEFQSNFIFISTDDLRNYYPAYIQLQKNPETFQNAANLVNPYASAWTERLIKYCIENQYNIIIDSTLGGNVDAVYKTIDMLRAKQFDLHLRVMAVPAMISKLSIFLRYETQLKEKGAARWTRMEDHDDRFEKIPLVLEQILTNKPPDSIRFYERVFDDNFTKSLNPSQVFLSDNDSFPKFVAIKHFQELRNQVKNNQISFIENTIKRLVSILKLRKNSNSELKNMILNESVKLDKKLKIKVLKLIEELKNV